MFLIQRAASHTKVFSTVNPLQNSCGSTVYLWANIQRVSRLILNRRVLDAPHIYASIMCFSRHCGLDALISTTRWNSYVRNLSLDRGATLVKWHKWCHTVQWYTKELTFTEKIHCAYADMGKTWGNNNRSAFTYVLMLHIKAHVYSCLYF